MLNAETRRRIDACRDILVGKIPNPQAQVEQITLALMYKFMNDMDREAEDLGGSAQFFSGEYADYSWDRIVDKKLGGEERIRLYAAGIEAVNKNPEVPELFREIFKNAYLPYRDPETFNLFAKEISAFRYDHSEDLGDAFEYLLSIMSSQGDAGQFRTPRHIIDFMAEVVEPQLGEKVLDPACGTAGFLIAAYKQIRKSKKNLTPAELEALHRSVVGYDISPDMVRLSRVNLYLHQFADPQVHEYDTLTDQARWSEKADVILANPPFMTPKGGIRPHKKFGISSNRSEVLFVDYIAEHLEAGGRAAVIVPEGIIFQSATAYRGLRAMLLDGYLWAVASLPAGVFNPYSGVKTSILFLDRKLARPEAPILFLKIEADGYDLGAQRRENGKNDIPAALSLLRDVRSRLRSGTLPADFHGPLDGHALSHLVVPRALVSAEADKNLSLERYRPKVAAGPQKWPMVKLGEVCEIRTGKKDVNQGNPAGAFPFFSCAQDHTYSDTYSFDQEALLIAGNGEVGTIKHYIGKFEAYQRTYVLGDFKDCSAFYLKNLIETRFKSHANQEKLGNTMPYIKKSMLSDFLIPLPPLSVQEEIVAEVKRYQAVIDGARAVTENWRPSFAVDPSWPMVKLGEVLLEKPRNGYSGKPVDKVTPVKVLSLSATTQGFLKKECFKYLDEDLPSDFYARCKKGDIYLQRGNTRELVGMPAVFDIDDADYLFPDLMIRLRPDTRKISVEFLYALLMTDDCRTYVTANAVGAAGSMPKINQSIVENIPLCLPPLPVQQEIVARIEEERALVRANEKLIELMKKRIEETVARVWG